MQRVWHIDVIAKNILKIHKFDDSDAFWIMKDNRAGCWSIYAGSLRYVGSYGNIQSALKAVRERWLK